MPYFHVHNLDVALKNHPETSSSAVVAVAMLRTYSCMSVFEFINVLDLWSSGLLRGLEPSCPCRAEPALPGHRFQQK